MSLLNRFRRGSHDHQADGREASHSATAAMTSDGQAGRASDTSNARLSNGLKDFLWHLSGVESGKLLDLGPVWQATVSFFTSRGFKVYTEDLMFSWKEFLAAEESRTRALPPDQAPAAILPAERAELFLRANLKYPTESFDAVLAWDLLDYFDADLANRVVDRLAEILKRGGVVMAIFHNRKPDIFHRYRILDGQNLELIPATALALPQRTFQNREILNLFSRFHSSKTYVGRDQLREGLFIR